MMVSSCRPGMDGIPHPLVVPAPPAPVPAPPVLVPPPLAPWPVDVDSTPPGPTLVDPLPQATIAEVTMTTARERACFMASEDTSARVAHHPRAPRALPRGRRGIDGSDADADR